MNDVEAHEVLHAGDPEDRDQACTEIFNRHAPWLIAALEKGGTPWEFADHGACQAFYKLTEMLTKDGTFNSADPEELRRWLYKVGRDAAVDEMRRQWKLRSGRDTFNLSELANHDQSPLQREDSSGESPVTLAEARCICANLWNLIQGLEPDHQFILLRDKQVLAALREYGGPELELYDEDLAGCPAAEVMLPQSLVDKRRRILEELRSKLGRSING